MRAWMPPPIFPSIMRIAYLDGPRLRRSLVAACEYTQQERRELNRINVFPVPDGDTGTNLALTVQAIADHLRGNRDRAVSAVAHEAAEAALLGARGNSGMMLSHFLLGFARRVEPLERMTTQEFGEAMTAGVTSLYAALDEPVEGTILTVMRETAEVAEKAGAADFVPYIDLLLETARASLDRTPQLLPVLAKAGVVDAGAKGFVHLLEGAALFINGDPIVAAGDEVDFSDLPPAVADFEYPEEDERYRYCTEALVRGESMPTSEAVRTELRQRGDSLIVIGSEDLLKVHLHTDDPEDVFTYLKGLGRLVTHKAEDMRVQYEAAGRASGHTRLIRRPITILTDSANDLPEEIIRAHGIHVVPLVLMDGDRVMRDGVDITAEEFHERMRDGPAGELPTTSQPPPKAFLDGFQRAAEDGEQILGVLLGSGLSGTFASGEAAALRSEGTPVHLCDSLGASLLQGLLVLKAAELAEAGMPPGEIIAELVRVRAQSGILLTVDTFDRLLHSGRVGKGRAWLGTVLSVKPILGLDEKGKVVPKGKAMGRARVLPAVMGILANEIPLDATQLRFGVVHVGCPEILDDVSVALRAQYGEVEIVTAPATPVISTHVGIGAWALSYLVED